ncbi:Saccharopine dehydrogenase-domain-containing protein [Xylariaceae sp. AK1471]|nr:Saccharopine dehydrogenase-domain-containing protein [Xylariaceae sp. AK1471]
MATPRDSRKYDIVLLGATGYTGGITAEHIARHLPTNIRWAIAGRSSTKLEALATKLNGLNTDRQQPVIEVLSFDDREALHGLVKQAKVCISVVSYWSVGTAVVEACVESATDYVDTEGDVSMLRQWIDKFHDRAAANGTILIHACGVFAAPEDVISWALVRELEKKHAAETKEVIFAFTELPQEISGGTIEAGAHPHPPAIAAQAENDAWYLSPTQGVKTSMSTNAFGIRQDVDMGVLPAAAFNPIVDRAIVHRTASLLRDRVRGYSPSFQYNEYVKASSLVDGLFLVLSKKIIDVVVHTPMLFKLARNFMPAPGDGPDVEKSRLSPTRAEAIAVAEPPPGETPRRMRGTLSYNSGPYLLTGLFMAEAAASLLQSRSLEGQLTGGCLSPAFLGDNLLKRLENVGVKIEISDV